MKVAILILANTETLGDLDPIVNALRVADELAEANDEVSIVFDGAATCWIGELDTKDHRHHGLFTRVKSRVAGACACCAEAFGVRDQILAAGVPLLNGHHQHPSVGGLAVEGFKVLTF